MLRFILLLSVTLGIFNQDIYAQTTIPERNGEYLGGQAIPGGRTPFYTPTYLPPGLMSIEVTLCVNWSSMGNGSGLSVPGLSPGNCFEGIHNLYISFSGFIGHQFTIAGVSMSGCTIVYTGVPFEEGTVEICCPDPYTTAQPCAEFGVYY